MHHTIVERAVCIAGLAAPVFLLLSVPLASADPPGNDNLASATVVPLLNFSDIVDTTEATTEAHDPSCHGDGHTVWYAFTPGEDVRVLVDTFGSDYDTTLSVYTDPPGGQIACNDDFDGAQSLEIFDAAAGTTYFIMAASYGEGNGGALQINFDTAPPPVEVDLTLDPKGSVDAKTGKATVSGAVYCSQPASGWVCGGLTQRVAGHVALSGRFCTYVECVGAGETTTWVATFPADNGYFKSGKGQVTADLSMCDLYECDYDYAEQAVQLLGG